MGYHCSKCGTYFEGQPRYCPECGCLLNYNTNTQSASQEHNELPIVPMVRRFDGNNLVGIGVIGIIMGIICCLFFMVVIPLIPGFFCLLYGVLDLKAGIANNELVSKRLSCVYYDPNTENLIVFPLDTKGEKLILDPAKVIRVKVPNGLGLASITYSNGNSECKRLIGVASGEEMVALIHDVDRMTSGYFDYRTRL